MREGNTYAQCQGMGDDNWGKRRREWSRYKYWVNNHMTYSPDLLTHPHQDGRERKTGSKRKRNEWGAKPKASQCLRKRGGRRGLVNMLAVMSDVTRNPSHVNFRQEEIAMDSMRVRVLWLSQRSGKGQGGEEDEWGGKEEREEEEVEEETIHWIRHWERIGDYRWVYCFHIEWKSLEGIASQP